MAKFILCRALSSPDRDAGLEIFSGPSIRVYLVTQGGKADLSTIDHPGVWGKDLEDSPSGWLRRLW